MASSHSFSSARTKIGNHYRNEWALLRSRYWKIFVAVALVLVVSAVVAFHYFGAHPAKADQALSSLRTVVLAKMPHKASGPGLALAIFWNNLRASVIALAAGLIPFLCLSAFLPIVNGGALGLLVFALKSKGRSVPLVVLVDLVPHGMFEIMAWLYASCLGVYLSLNIVSRVLAPRGMDGRSAPSDVPSETRAKGSAAENVSLVVQVLTSFVRVVIPLLLAAALIEAFITPLLHKAVFG
jgi:stage II sporulation protein M